MGNIKRYQLGQRNEATQRRMAADEKYFRELRSGLSELKGHSFLEQVKAHASAKRLDKLPQYTQLQIALAKAEKDIQTQHHILPKTLEAIIQKLVALEKSAPPL